MSDQPQSFEISAELGNRLTSYLGTRPYQEVAGLIMGLQQAFGASALPKAPTEPVADTPSTPAPDNGATPDQGSEPAGESASEPVSTVDAPAEPNHEQ